MAVKDFWERYLGASLGSGPRKIRETKLCLQLNNFAQELDFDVILVQEKSVQDLKRKKEKNKTILTWLKVGL